MTNQTALSKCLGGSQAGTVVRFCTLTLVAISLTAGAAFAFAQSQPAPSTNAQPAKAKLVKQKKPAAESADKTAGHYLVHQSLEVGGRYTTTGGSPAMWATLVNMGSGGRILEQSLDMHSLDPSKTRFFDTLTSASTGYGGDPYDVTRLKFSKGRAYDFSGSFRRDRNFFDYNLLDNSLLGSKALVPEPDSLHLFNTVRRNTDTSLTILPLSLVSFRVAYNRGTHEGPSFTSAHDGGDVQLAQWFRNGSDTYDGGVDWKPAPRTSLSYDQFFVLYKGDSTFALAGANYPVLGGNGLMESLGVDTLSTATCGSGVNKTTEIYNGYANPYCSGTLAMSQVAPTRTKFPTEQLRFQSHYWQKVALNGRVLYSDATGSVNQFNETFNGFNSRGYLRQTVETGGFANGALAQLKRVNTSADFGVEAEINRFIAVSEAFNYWNFHNQGNSSELEETWAGNSSTNILTPIGGLTPTQLNPSPTLASSFLAQKIAQNTALAIFSVAPQVNISAGYRFRMRQINDPHATGLTWHEGTVLLGAVMQPNRMVRVNLNFDTMNSDYASGAAVLGQTSPATSLGPSNTFTREAVNHTWSLRARATLKPAKWINFAVAGKDFEGENNDPMVNHKEHNRDGSVGASIVPTEQISIDFNYAYDDVYSKTDLCYISTPAPTGAVNGGACVNSAANPEGSASLFLGTGLFDAPTHFYSGAVTYSPTPLFHFSGGARVNDTNGTAEQLSPLMVPGALQSRYISPFGDAEYKIASQWAWHGNFRRTQYSEQGPVGTTASRATQGNVLTLGVRYAF